MGATATDHGHHQHGLKIYHTMKQKNYLTLFYVMSFLLNRQKFWGQMLTEMARMSCEDGLIVQIHPGSKRNHSEKIYCRFGALEGFDILGEQITFRHSSHC